MFIKFTVAALAILATAVQANPHEYHHQRLHRRAQAYNASPTTGDIVFTISTVYSTQEITITSCAATITDCPADKMTETFVTTVIVPAYTTICPVTATETGTTLTETVLPVPASTGTSPLSTTAVQSSPSGSLVGTAPLSTTAAASFASTTTPLNTAPPAPLSTGSPDYTSPIAPGNGYSTSTLVSNSTLTYTLGAGSSTTVVTTTYFHTSTEYIYNTVTETLPSSPESTNNGAVVGSGPTTTILSTSTRTIYITVVEATPSASAPGAPGSVGSPASTNNGALGGSTTEASGSGPTGAPSVPGSPGGGSTETGCAPLVTVTVTEKEVVTVTAEPTPLSQSAAPTFSSAPYTWVNGTSPTATITSTGFITVPYPTASGSGSVQWGAYP